jgi:hypothetical protein
MAFDAHLQMFFCFFEKHVIQSYLVGGDWNIWMIFPRYWKCYHPN